MLDGHLPDDFAHASPCYEAERFVPAPRRPRSCGRAATCSRPTGATTAPDALAPGVRIPDAFLARGRAGRATAPARCRVDGEPLRLLYLGRDGAPQGRAEPDARGHRARAATTGDADAARRRHRHRADAARSLRAALELMAAGDPRIALPRTRRRATRSSAAPARRARRRRAVAVGVLAQRRARGADAQPAACSRTPRRRPRARWSQPGRSGWLVARHDAPRRSPAAIERARGPRAGSPTLIAGRAARATCSTS